MTSTAWARGCCADQETLLDELDRARRPRVRRPRTDAAGATVGARARRAGRAGRQTCVQSGGQRKLIALASCLAQEPDLLLLDEPETHLDTDARTQLETLIRDFAGAVVVVSHDRYLLDETVFYNCRDGAGRIRIWPGSYSAYAVARELEMQRQEQLFVTQQKEIARLEEAIRRFRHWAHIEVNERHIKQARNKQRQIDRMEKVDRPVLERRKMALRLRSERRGGQRIVELDGASVALGGEHILVGVDLTVMRGERVGVIGRNGAGKSVLVRMLTGELELDEGRRWIGPSIEVGRLAQDHDSLPASGTPLDAVRRQRPCTEGEAVQILMRFLFSYEQVRQPVARLSGGERTRLATAASDAKRCQLLGVGRADQPLGHRRRRGTGGRDRHYDGTVVFVSHDRYFLDRIADRIVHVADGAVRSYEGGWSANAGRAGGRLGPRLRLRRRLAELLLRERQRPALHVAESSSSR